MYQDMSVAPIMFAAAVLWDAVLGEYPRAFHPVVWLGKAIGGCVRLAPAHGWWRQFVYGILLAVALPAVSVAVVMLVLHYSAPFAVLHAALGVFFLKGSMALRELVTAAQRVYESVQRGDLPAARTALRSLCSRDPSELAGEDLLEAAVESLAENLSDSWVAPLFYFVLFGVPGAVAYRVVNTLDAMIGYRGHYEALGKFSARLDDLLNYIPARLTTILLLLAGLPLHGDLARGWRIVRRDGGNTPSPNGGRPMAAMAGLLGVKLEKRGVYSLGDPVLMVTVAKAREAERLVVGTGALMIFVTLAAMLALHTMS